MSPSCARSQVLAWVEGFFTQLGFRSKIKKSALESEPSLLGSDQFGKFLLWLIATVSSIWHSLVDISASGSPCSTSCSSPHVCETEWPVVDRTMTSKKWALTGGFLYRGAHRIKQRRVRIPSTSNYEQSHALYLIFVPLCSSSNHSGQRSMPSQTQARNAM